LGALLIGRQPIGQGLSPLPAADQEVAVLKRFHVSADILTLKPRPYGHHRRRRRLGYPANCVDLCYWLGQEKLGQYRTEYSAYSQI
jgi:hypothetical protein